MNDTDKPDPVLKQVPLVRNPAFNPPKPVTLNTNYSNLIANLPRTVKPPKMNMTENDLRKWADDIEQMKPQFDVDSEENKKEVSQYRQWLQQKKIRVAPGFDSSVMKPSSRSISATPTQEQAQDLNDLDRAFGKAKIND